MLNNEAVEIDKFAQNLSTHGPSAVTRSYRWYIQLTPDEPFIYQKSNSRMFGISAWGPSVPQFLIMTLILILIFRTWSEWFYPLIKIIFY